MAEIKVPELAESVTEGTIAQWLKQEGEFVEKGEPIIELETDKINLEVNSDFSGVLTTHKKAVGDTVEVGEVIAILDEDGKQDGASSSETPKQAEESVKQETETTSQPAPEETVKTGQKPIASPAVRKKARELGVDLNQVASTDPLGRIRAEDLTNKPASAKPAPAPETKQPEQDEHKPVERIKMSRRRQTIAKRLVEAQQTAAMLTTFNEVDMTAVMDVRKRRKDAFQKKHDVKLGFMSFFTKAVVGALKAFPYINAEIQGNEIVLKKFYDVGIAVAASEGLVVPVVRNADRLSFAEIEREIGNLSEKARHNKLGLSDLQGGTFTITNGGIFGSLYSTPILNAPQVGILGMHTIQRRPVVVDDNDTIEVRPMMYIALSYDHRIVDGSEAVQFLVKIKQLLEDPESLLLEG